MSTAFPEYDDDRSGDFKPLDEIPNGGAAVVLVSLLQNTGNWKTRRLLERIEEAVKCTKRTAEIKSAMRLRINAPRNILTEDEQGKLRYIVQLADELL